MFPLTAVIDLIASRDQIYEMSIGTHANPEPLNA